MADCISLGVRKMFPRKKTHIIFVLLNTELDFRSCSLSGEMDVKNSP